MDVESSGVCTVLRLLALREARDRIARQPASARFGPGFDVAKCGLCHVSLWWH